MSKKNNKKESKTILRSTFQIYAVAALIAAVLTAVSAWLINDSLVNNKEVGLRTSLTQQRAGMIAQDIEASLKTKVNQIDLVADRDAFVRALVSNETDEVRSYMKMLSTNVDGFHSVNFFKTDTIKRNSKGNFPIGFADIDLVKRVELGELMRPEVVKVNNAWLVNLAVRVPADRKLDPIGTLLVRIHADEITKVITASSNNVATVDVEQRYGGGKGLKFAHYRVAKPAIGDTQEAFVKNSYWYVLVTPNENLLNEVGVDRVKPVIIILLTAVLYFGLSLYVASRVLRERVRIDEITVDTASMAQSEDILDMPLSVDDESEFGFDEVVEPEEPQALEEIEELNPYVIPEEDVPAVIFRAYDIRGLAKTQVTPNVAKYVGQAIASEALDCGQTTLVVARDARTHSPELVEFLIRGILSTGCNVLNIGTVPTPLMYFAISTLSETQSGVMVTASHNPKEYNGFKMVVNGKVRSDEEITAIRERILRGEFHEGHGSEQRLDVVPQYIETIFSDVALAGDISVVIDAGNGVTGNVAPKLFEELGCQVTPLFCDIDGEFPNHDPDPTVEANLSALIEKVADVGADLGVAFDGDGDRIVVVTPSGKVIWPDRLLMLFAKDILSRNPGADVVFDVKSTRHLAAAVTSFGGRPIMWKTGHAPMKRKMQETGALVGGEYSGHLFIKDRWFGFDDGMYAAARLVEILSLQGESADMVFQSFPESPATPEIRVAIDESKKFEIIESLKLSDDFEDAKVTTIDGLRADFPFGWGLVRASNTSAHLTLRFEADDDASLHHVKSLFVRALRNVDNTIQINWE